MMESIASLRARTQFAQTMCVGHREQNYLDFLEPFHSRWMNLGLLVRDRSVVVD